MCALVLIQTPLFNNSNYLTAKWELTKANTEFLKSYIIQKNQIPNQTNLIIYLEGHTDDVGNSDFNLQLSQKRVQAVADYIKSKGFNESNIKISWHGKSQPETRKIVTIRIEKL